jgi:hypothetical protein
MSCNQAQGYYYSRPLKLADLDIFASHSSPAHFSLDSSNSNISALSQSVLSSLAKS